MPELLEISSLFISSPGSLITGDGQLEYNEYVLGDDNITFLEEINGWEDLPPIDSSNTLRPSTHGAWVGKKLVGQRVITWKGRFAAPRDEWEAEMKRLRSAFSVPNGTEELTIVVRTRNETKMVFGTVSARAIPMNYQYGYYGAQLTIQFECSDPRRYSLGENTAFISMPTQLADGLSYPLDYPLDYGAEATPSQLIILNDGDAPSPLTLNFVGPATNPTLINQTTGERLGFDIVLAAEDTLTVNTRLGTVLLNGTADRLYTRSLTSSPILGFDLMPGENDMQAIADEWEEGSGIEVIYRDATF
jgi:tail protein